MADQGVSDLIKGISDDVKLLVRDEIQLAKTELVPAAKNAGIGAGLFGAAGYFAISALSVLYFAAAFALAQVVDTWLAFLIVGVVLLLIAAVLGLVGFVLVKRVKAPEKTIANAQALVAELSTAVNRATAAASAPRIEGTVVNDKKALR
jgi:hypothetical protein